MSDNYFKWMPQELNYLIVSYLDHTSINRSYLLISDNLLNYQRLLYINYPILTNKMIYDIIYKDYKELYLEILYARSIKAYPIEAALNIKYDLWIKQEYRYNLDGITGASKRNKNLCDHRSLPSAYGATVKERLYKLKPIIVSFLYLKGIIKLEQILSLSHKYLFKLSMHHDEFVGSVVNNVLSQVFKSFTIKDLSKYSFKLSTSKVNFKDLYLIMSKSFIQGEKPLDNIYQEIIIKLLYKTTRNEKFDRYLIDSLLLKNINYNLKSKISEEYSYFYNLDAFFYNTQLNSYLISIFIESLFEYHNTIPNESVKHLINKILSNLKGSNVTRKFYFYVLDIYRQTRGSDIIKFIEY